MALALASAMGHHAAQRKPRRRSKLPPVPGKGNGAPRAPRGA